MKPTLPWMGQTFDEYNAKYFGGRLARPYFSLRCNPNYWGYYQPNATYNRITRRTTVKSPGTLFLNGIDPDKMTFSDIEGYNPSEYIDDIEKSINYIYGASENVPKEMAEQLNKARASLNSLIVNAKVGHGIKSPAVSSETYLKHLDTSFAASKRKSKPPLALSTIISDNLKLVRLVPSIIFSRALTRFFLSASEIFFIPEYIFVINSSVSRF